MITSKILLVGIDRFSLCEYDCETLIAELDNLHIYNTEVEPFSFVQPYMYELLVRTDLYNELYGCLETGFASQFNTQIFYERGLKALKNPDVFNYYGCLFPSLASSAFIEAQTKLLLTDGRILELC
ncbi:MAG: hypothetical protein MZV49_00905 [Rhodopseudomonas palustris]|nr:hypothetical protein [Rhodopseudomonas palustris]